MRKNSPIVPPTSRSRSRSCSPRAIATIGAIGWRYAPLAVPQFAQERDVLFASKVVVVLPIDLARDEIVLVRQFRLPAHLANKKGDVIEFVAGRVDPNETLKRLGANVARE